MLEFASTITKNHNPLGIIIVDALIMDYCLPIAINFY
jgi:hypothetical protein